METKLKEKLSREFSLRKYFLNNSFRFSQLLCKAREDGEEKILKCSGVFLSELDFCFAVRMETSSLRCRPRSSMNLNKQIGELICYEGYRDERLSGFMRALKF